MVSAELEDPTPLGLAKIKWKFSSSLLNQMKNVKRSTNWAIEALSTYLGCPHYVWMRKSEKSPGQ